MLSTLANLTKSKHKNNPKTELPSQDLVPSVNQHPDSLHVKQKNPFPTNRSNPPNLFFWNINTLNKYTDQEEGQKD